jgi:hypothetical protein
MSFLEANSSGILAARITDYGRKKIAQGNFNISYFQIGDSEFDYGFSEFDGITNPPQKVLSPMDKDSQVKYPYKVSESTLTGTTYGIPQQFSETKTIKNNMGPAGYVLEYVEFDGSTGNGTTVVTPYEVVDISAIDGSAILFVPNSARFYNTQYITIVINNLGINDVIMSNATSLVYKVTSVVGNALLLDRGMPNLWTLNPKNVIVISNEYSGSTVVCGEITDNTEQQASWNLENVWSAKPAGLDVPTEDERLSGYTSNIYVSTKEYFGYNTSSGQTQNTGTTITNSFGDSIMVLPEEQHSLSILHFTRPGDILIDPNLTFKYEDYIAHSTSDDIEYFEIYIPFMYYDRNTGTTVGSRFFMDSTDYYIDSYATDTRMNQMKYRYLLDENNYRVGKIFVNHQVIVFDDQEMVAILDYKSNRRYTLPIPRISMIPPDSKCDENGDVLTPLLNGTGDTVFVTYLLKYNQDINLNGMHCNHYSKIVGTETPGDVSIKFGDNCFTYMKALFMDVTTGYIANEFHILVQKVATGQQPDPTLWVDIDFTDQIPNHLGGLIDPVNLRGARFVITNADYENNIRYDLETYLGQLPDEPSTLPEFGDEQPFTGSIKLTRATDVEVLRFLISLPTDDFTTTQNPSYIDGVPKRFTEVALLDENKNVLVMAKTTSPVVRIGAQVVAVKIDI